MFQADLEDEEWIHKVAPWRPELILISAPCVSWSFAGGQGGLAQSEGLLLPKSLSACKLLRPKVIGIEQVPGFLAHQDSKLIISQLNAMGYRVHHSKVLDSSDFGCALRSRFLCVAVRTHDSDIADTPFVPWKPQGPLTPAGMATMLDLPQHVLEQLRVKDEALASASNPAHLPTHLRIPGTQAGEQTLSLRCHSGQSTLPTFLAMYGQRIE